MLSKCLRSCLFVRCFFLTSHYLVPVMILIHLLKHTLSWLQSSDSSAQVSHVHRRRFMTIAMKKRRRIIGLSCVSLQKTLEWSEPMRIAEQLRKKTWTVSSFGTCAGLEQDLSRTCQTANLIKLSSRRFYVLIKLAEVLLKSGLSTKNGRCSSIFSQLFCNPQYASRLGGLWKLCCRIGEGPDLATRRFAI